MNLNTVSLVSTANPNATSAAKALLKFLYEISGQKILSGQHNCLGRLSLASDRVYSITGKYPAIWGSDFGFADESHDIDNIKYRSLLVPEIEKQHARGCIIAMTYHQANPVIGEPCAFQSGVISKLTAAQWQDLITPDTPLYLTWRRQMDLFAGYLQQVQALNIPVLFRPYHEMNGDWFWWGQKTGVHGYVQLWRQLFDYYTRVHQLHNLLWVWSPDKPSFGLREYYPGDEYVDVIASDIYPIESDPVVFRKEWYDELVHLAAAKPLAIGENSILPTETELLEQPRWVWFFSWNNLVLKNRFQQLRTLYHSDRVLTAEDLSRFNNELQAR